MLVGLGVSELIVEGVVGEIFGYEFLKVCVVYV